MRTSAELLHVKLWLEGSFITFLLVDWKLSCRPGLGIGRVMEILLPLLLHWRLQLINIAQSVNFLCRGRYTDEQVFLSSTEAQYVVNALWKGDLVQMNNDDEDIDYVPYETSESGSFWDHMNPQRISVPRYQAAFKIVVWIIFLFGASLLMSMTVD